jgi:ABC-type transport system involved in Fe-S cluster assembly fused permease/ATPase subunit
VRKEPKGPFKEPLRSRFAQAAGRRLSYYALVHVLGLDLQFHLNRRTGAAQCTAVPRTSEVVVRRTALLWTGGWG